ncbi:hypothetical protein SISNIDRAFT_458142 [Sistotremastrum niveocremeum HHB9708]|uniref:Uncharacterized protein n=1 Tax=Sistotremastrum niveocremeum HHB9708 TaxID=1314777 RepID=A0A164R2M5_9AGAM|nr:hypothetical protein SISNIDRAFT_458142 [Sistotremastrum niveocremeum HHB9708]
MQKDRESGDLELGEQETRTALIERVKYWRDMTSVELVFVTLFLTIVTAFLSPISQLYLTPLLGGGTSYLAKAQGVPPNIPLELASGSYCLSMAFGYLCASACLWVVVNSGQVLLDLDSKAPIQHFENTGQVLEQVVSVAHITLFPCIILGAFGGIAEMWTAALSFSDQQPLLLTCIVIVSILGFMTFVSLIVVMLHAIAHDDSPYANPWSDRLRACFSRRKNKRPSSINKEDQQVQSRQPSPEPGTA